MVQTVKYYFFNILFLKDIMFFQDMAPSTGFQTQVYGAPLPLEKNQLVSVLDVGCCPMPAKTIASFVIFHKTYKPKCGSQYAKILRLKPKNLIFFEIMPLQAYNILYPHI